MIELPCIAFYTLGCKVNHYETEAIYELFKQAGYERVDFDEVADVYVINTCTVTNTGDKKSRQIIRRAIRKNPDAVVCVTGCYAQTKPNEIAEIEGVDLIIGTNGRENIVNLVKDFLENRKPITYVKDLFRDNPKFENIPVINYESRTRANLKIQEGCQNFCTFCIIPYARGKMRSKDPESVVNEVQNLVNNGHLEIIFTGIHTGGYGVDFEDYDLADLIKEVEEKVVGLKRIRISSIEMTQLDDKMIEIMKHSKVLARHFHVPIQSGTNTVLERMNRKYTTEAFIEKMDEIKALFPDIALTTDVIVGFPGETDEELQETKEFIKRIGFSELHVFPYSPRMGTKAAKMSNQVPNIVKSMRVNELLALSNELAQNYVNKIKDQIIPVIFEEQVTGEDGMILGHASHYIKVKASGSEDYIGKEAMVRIKDASYPIAYGEIL
jgi:threonylcarbamoyladenosine tRNA methylthiotransferase MtaB